MRGDSDGIISGQACGMMTVAELRRVVVTGGMGFIGSNYVRLMQQWHPQWRVVVLDKLTYAGNIENLADLMDRITFVHGDIADPAAAEEALGGADAVIHLAAESHVDRSLLSSREFVRTNVEGTSVLLETAYKCGVRRFLYASTDEVYGDVTDTGKHSVEDDPIRPRSPYAATKAAAEHLVLSYGTSFGLDVVVTRGSNTYGPHQYPEKIVPLFITNALEDRAAPAIWRWNCCPGTICMLRIMSQVLTRSYAVGSRCMYTTLVPVSNYAV